MNILIFSWRGPGHPKSGGAEIANHEHAKRWVKAGHQVTLFTSTFSGCRKRETINGVEIIREGNDIFGVHIAGFLWYLFGKHKKFDLVVDEFHGIPFFTPIYVRTKKLAFIHEVAKEVWALNPWPKPFNLIPLIIGTIFEPFVFKIFYQKIKFMTVSDSTKDELSKFGINKKNITVIKNGISSPRRILPKEKTKTLIFLGAITKDKGIDDAIDMFALVSKALLDSQMWIVGKGEDDYVNSIKKKIRNSNLENTVKIWGFVSESKKYELLGKSHLMINPSIREGWALVNIEANSVGTPVIAYNVPGCRDSIRNQITGVLVKPHSISEMSEVAIATLENKHFYNKLQKNAVNWSKEFDWDKAGKESLELISF